MASVQTRPHKGTLDTTEVYYFNNDKNEEYETLAKRPYYEMKHLGFKEVPSCDTFNYHDVMCCDKDLHKKGHCVFRTKILCPNCKNLTQFPYSYTGRFTGLTYICNHCHMISSVCMSCRQTNDKFLRRIKHIDYHNKNNMHVDDIKNQIEEKCSTIKIDCVVDDNWYEDNIYRIFLKGSDFFCHKDVLIIKNGTGPTFICDRCGYFSDEDISDSDL